MSARGCVIGFGVAAGSRSGVRGTLRPQVTAAETKAASTAVATIAVVRRDRGDSSASSTSGREA